MTNKKIWILRTGEPIFSDGIDIRPQRAINLARKMSSLGFDVKLISPIFYHQKKIHRNIKSPKGNYFEGIEEILLWSPGYKNHISLGRFIDHSILSINLFFYFLRVRPKNRPDIIYVGYPPVDWAFVSVIAAKLFKIKSIVEVEDLWPDLFKQRVKGRFSKLLISILSLPYVFYARVIVLLSDKISSPTIEMADFFIKKYGEKKNYLEYKKKIFETPLIPPKLIEKDEDFSELESLKILKNLDNLKIFFAGSLMSVYDFKTVSEAFRLLNK